MAAGLKRIIGLIMAWVLCFPSGVWAREQVFQDMKGHWAEGTISEWVQNGWITGQSDGRFNAAAAITRAEIAALVNRSFGYADKASISFKDVSSKDWFYSDVAAAVRAGYMEGYHEGTFRPGATISRQELAVLIARLLALPLTAPGEAYKDAAQAPEWSRGSIGAVMKSGIMVGRDSHSFGLTASTTRAEAVVVLDRALRARSGSQAPLVYDKAGVYGEEQHVTMDRSLRIAAPGVTLQNMTVTRDVYIDKTVGEGDVTFSSVTVKGRTEIRGGGENSVHFKDSALGQVVINKEGGTVRVVSEGSSTVANYIVLSPVKLDNETGSAVSDITIDPGLPAGSTVVISGNYNAVHVKASGIKVIVTDGTIQSLQVHSTFANNTIRLEKGSVVAQLTLGAQTKVTGEGAIRAATLTAAGSEIEQQPDKLELSDGVTATVSGKPASSGVSAGTGGGVPGGGGGAPAGGIPGGGTPGTGGGSSGGGNPGAGGGSPGGGNPGGNPDNGGGTPGGGNPGGVNPGTGEGSPGGGNPGGENPGTGGGTPGDNPGTGEGGGTGIGLQDTLLPSPVTARSGAAVVLSGAPAPAVAVWLAPLGTARFAEGETMTRLSGDGRTRIIDAPWKEGAYRLFAIGTDGSVSAPSRAALTVQNTANVSGTVKYKDGSPVTRATLLVEKAVGQAGSFTVPVVDGKYSRYLPDGEYRMASLQAEGKAEPLQLYNRIAVQRGNLLRGETDLTAVESTANNVTGTLKYEDGSALGQGYLEIRNYDRYEQLFSVPIRQGQFAMYLPDGVYITDLYRDGALRKQVPVSKIFIVSGGTSFPVHLTLRKENVTGSFSSGDGAAIGDGEVRFFKQGDAYSEYKTAVVDGKFGLYLPDGQYETAKFEGAGRSAWLKVSFEVESGAASAPLTLALPADNVTGRIKLGETFIQDGTVSIERKGNPGSQMSVKIQNGEFGFYLSDGEYTITDFIPKNGGWMHIYYTFTVTDGQAGPLIVSVPNRNVTGTISFENGGPIEWAQLNFMDDEKVYYFMTDIKNGAFSDYLPDGRYRITYEKITDQVTTVLPLPETVTVTNGIPDRSSLSIVITESNVTGTVLQPDGSRFDGTLHLQRKRVGAEQIPSYAVDVVNGMFSLYLPDGEYETQLIQYRNRQTKPFVTDFTVNGSSSPVLAVPADNVKGSVTLESGEPVAGITINVTDKAGKYYSIPVAGVTFATYFPDGEYEVNGYWDWYTGENRTLTDAITVSGGKADRDPIRLVVHDPNVTGVVNYADGKPREPFFIYAVSEMTGKTYPLIVRGGKFEEYLPDGSYSINGFYDLVTNRFVEVNKTFQVKDGKPSEKPVTIEVPAVLMGTVLVDGGAIPDDGELLVQEAVYGETPMMEEVPVSNGRFSIELPYGDYKAVQYRYVTTGETVELDLPFTYSADSPEGHQLQLILPKGNVWGTLTRNGEPVSSVQLEFYSEAGGYFATTVRSGRFETTLPDGEYRVVAYSNLLTAERGFMPGTFRVNGGISEPAALALSIPAPNLSGTFKHSDGTPVANAVLHATSDMFPGLIIIPVRDGRYSVYLPDGDYRFIGYSNQDNLEEGKLSFAFTLKEGRADRNLDFVMYPPNIEGSVKNENGTAITAFALLIIDSETSSDHYEILVRDGVFRAYLPDGDYQIAGLAFPESGRFVPISKPLSIVGGKPEDESVLTIVVPEP